MEAGGNRAERVWIVRHGQTEDNLHERERLLDASEYNRIIQTSGERPLTEDGRRQVEEVAEFFRERPLAAVHSSPLLRARHSAEIIADRLGLPVVDMEGFREFVPTEIEPAFCPGRSRTLRYWFLSSMARQFIPIFRVSESVWKARGRIRAAWGEVVTWTPPERNGKPEGITERLVVSHRGALLLLRSSLRWNREWEITRWSDENAGITEVVRC